MNEKTDSLDLAAKAMKRKSPAEYDAVMDELDQRFGKTESMCFGRRSLTPDGRHLPGGTDGRGE